MKLAFWRKDNPFAPQEKLTKPAKAVQEVPISPELAPMLSSMAAMVDENRKAAEYQKWRTRTYREEAPERRLEMQRLLLEASGHYDIKYLNGVDAEQLIMDGEIGLIADSNQWSTWRTPWLDDEPRWSRALFISESDAGIGDGRGKKYLKHLKELCNASKEYDHLMRWAPVASRLIRAGVDMGDYFPRLIAQLKEAYKKEPEKYESDLADIAVEMARSGDVEGAQKIANNLSELSRARALTDIAVLRIKNRPVDSPDEDRKRYVYRQDRQDVLANNPQADLKLAEDLIGSVWQRTYSSTTFGSREAYHAACHLIRQLHSINQIELAEEVADRFREIGMSGLGGDLDMAFVDIALDQVKSGQDPREAMERVKRYIERQERGNGEYGAKMRATFEAVHGRITALYLRRMMDRLRKEHSQEELAGMLKHAIAQDDQLQIKALTIALDGERVVEVLRDPTLKPDNLNEARETIVTSLESVGKDELAQKIKAPQERVVVKPAPSERRIKAEPHARVGDTDVAAAEETTDVVAEEEAHAENIRREIKRPLKQHKNTDSAGV